MTGNISYLSEYEPYDGGYVSFGQGGGKITGKGIIQTDFKLKDDTNVLLRTPRQHNMYSTDLNNIAPHKNLTCLVAKASIDEKMNEFCTKRGIRREFSNAKTPQQNGVAKRRNRTLIEAAKTMLADAKLPVTFWAEAVNTAYHLGKFDAKGDEGYFVGYSMSSKAFRWLLHEHILLTFQNSDGCNANDPESSGISNPTATLKIPSAKQVEPAASLTVETKIPTVSSPVPTVCLDTSPGSSSDPRIISKVDFSQQETPSLGNALTLSNKFKDIFREEADLSNMETSIPVSPTPTVIIHKDHPKSQIIGPVNTTVQTRHKSREMEEQSFISTIHYKTNSEFLQFCLFLCFLSQKEPKKIFDALKDPSWVEAMHEELLQFKIKNVWILVNYPKGVRPIGIKWVLKNKKDDRGIVIRNKARLVAQGYTQEEGIDYEEVFTPVIRIEAIWLFLAYASFMGFTVYQMDVKSAFLYGTIDEEVYMMQPPRFQDPKFPDRVYKVEKAIYGLHQAPKAWYGTLSKYLLDNGFQRRTIDQTLFIRKHKGEFLLVQVYVDDIIFGSSNPQLCREFEALMHEKFQMSAMGELTFFLGLQVLQKKDGIFLSQDKYVGDILKTFGYSDVRSANTPMDKENPWGKDGPGHPKLGLWYPKDSHFHLVAYSDSDYDGATQDRKSTTGGCQFLGRRLILWQCKKQTIVATSTTKTEYVAAASGCRQVLWIQNQMLDYGAQHRFHQIVDFLEASHISPKSTGFNEFSSNIATAVGEGSTIPTEPHHTPSPQEQHSPHHDPSSPSHPTTSTKLIPQTPTKTPTKTPTLMQYSKRATRIA
nr:hypothetical protein [Tanacetum cinerariifolium]